MKYSELTRRAEALACILGSVLLLAASLFFVAGQQAVESVLGFSGTILLIPLLLALARRLGKQMPRYGLACAALSLVGWAGGAFMMAMRGVYVALVRAEVPAIVAAGNFERRWRCSGRRRPSSTLSYSLPPSARSRLCCAASG